MKELTTEQLSKNSEFTEWLKSNFGDKITCKEVMYIDRDTKMLMTCYKHGDFISSKRLLSNNIEGCKFCGVVSIREQYRRDHIALAEITHAGKYDYSEVELKNFNDPVTIICPIHGRFKQYLYQHAVVGTNCQACAADNNGLKQEQFIAKAIEIHGDKYLYDRVVYTTGQDKVIIGCPLHGYWEQRANSHTQGNGCGQCNIESSRIGIEIFIERAREIHGERYDYSLVTEYKSAATPVKIICPKHGMFRKTPGSHIQTRSGCPRCRESMGEVSVSNFLTRYNIPFIKEYRIGEERYRYDFFLKGFNILVEFHGIQHYRPVERYDGKVGFALTQKRDREKIKLAAENGYRLIVLSCFNHQKGNCLDFIPSLKEIYPFWLGDATSTVAFKTVSEVMSFFDIIETTTQDDLFRQVELLGFKVLF